jgi:O-acetylhomoserine/O-acetylserine sulfhydrylase
MSEKDRREAGITPVSRSNGQPQEIQQANQDMYAQAFIRFSVGTEDVRDIIGDLDQALNALPEDIVNAHDEKLEKLEAKFTNGQMAMDGSVPIRNGNGKVDYTDDDALLAKSSIPVGRQTAVGNW